MIDNRNINPDDVMSAAFILTVIGPRRRPRVVMYRPVDLHDPMWRDALPRWIRISAIDVHLGRLMEHVRR